MWVCAAVRLSRLLPLTSLICTIFGDFLAVVVPCVALGVEASVHSYSVTPSGKLRRVLLQPPVVQGRGEYRSMARPAGFRDSIVLRFRSKRRGSRANAARIRDFCIT